MKVKSPRLCGEKIRYTVTPSLHGNIGTVWTLQKGKNKVIAILLPGKRKMDRAIRESFPGASPGSRREIETLGRMLARYMEGKDAAISPDLFDMKLLYSFQKKVLMKCRQIPRGKVLSYGGLAKKIGVPRAARAVGTALARNPYPLVLPCHRVVQSTGRPGNFGQNPAMKIALLAGEGVRINRRGIVNEGSFWK